MNLFNIEKKNVSIYIHKYNFKRFSSSLNYQKQMDIYLVFQITIVLSLYIKIYKVLK